MCLRPKTPGQRGTYTRSYLLYACTSQRILTSGQVNAAVPASRPMDSPADRFVGAIAEGLIGACPIATNVPPRPSRSQ